MQDSGDTEQAEFLVSLLGADPDSQLGVTRKVD